MKLFEPGNIGKLTFKNRIAMAPLHVGELVALDGRLTQRGIDYYAARAKGGTGLIITCAARTSRETERHIRRLRVDNFTDKEWLGKLADAVHSYGAKVALQISAGAGRVGAIDHANRSSMVAPSALPCFWDPNVITRELTTEEIAKMVQAFRFAAEIVKAAGIDAIELHGHEGYLFDQFKTALWNKRIDKYGGDLEGRLRFSLEVIEAIKIGAGADFPIIYRFGLTHYLPGGREIDEGLSIARRLEAAGVDALDVDAGCYETPYWPHPPTTQPPCCMVDLAEMVKKVVSIPVMAVGKLGYPDLAERILEEKKADFIILGRALLADPEWPNKVKDGKLDDICPCIGDHECIGGFRVPGEGDYISCTVNPAAGMERELTIRRAKKRRSVLVVGGGPGGLEAAITAALRGHNVTLWEKDNALGGNLIPASVPDFKQDYKNLINYLSTQVKKLGVTVELAKEATPKIVQKSEPDVVFIATGSTPIIPAIPGIDLKTVVTATDLLLGRREAGDSVVVLGGGLVGSETALYLAQKGKKVTIVEALDSPARDMILPNRMHLLKLLADGEVEILTETQVLEITENGNIIISIVNGNGRRRTLRTDTIVIAVGLEPNNRLLESLTGKMPNVYAIGDCVEPRKVINAIWEGFRAARLV